MNADDNTDDDDKPLPSGVPEDRIKGPTFDIMSDEEIEVAHERILGMIDEAEGSDSSDENS